MLFESIRGHTVCSSMLGRKPVVVDLGANKGEFSRQMAARFGAECYLVEGNPDLAAALEVAGGFPVRACAVTATDGVVEFNIANNDEASSVLALTEDSIHGDGVRESVQVNARSLETLVREFGLGRIDLLKMDIEGGEVAVLQAVPRSVLGKIAQLSAEFHSHEEFGFPIREQVEQIILRMEKEGFLFLDFSYGTRCDVLFINRNLQRVSMVQEWMWKFRVSPPGWCRAAWSAIPSGPKEWLRSAASRASGIDRNR